MISFCFLQFWFSFIGQVGRSFGDRPGTESFQVAKCFRSCSPTFQSANQIDMVCQHREFRVAARVCDKTDTTSLTQGMQYGIIVAAFGSVIRLALRPPTPIRRSRWMGYTACHYRSGCFQWLTRAWNGGWSSLLGGTRKHSLLLTSQLAPTTNITLTSYPYNCSKKKKPTKSLVNSVVVPGFLFYLIWFLL